MDIVPNISAELIDYLKKLYPDKAPDSHQTDRDIWIDRGAVGVVRHLVHVHELQNENILTSFKK